MKKTNFNVILFGALIIAASFMLLSGQLFAQVTKEVKFTTTGSEQTWTIPAGVSEVTIECWGGGGAGGFMGSSVRAASGGGGGAYAKKTLAVEQCTDLTIKVGAGGSGQKSTNGIGEDSYVKYNSTTVVLAVGGGDVGDNVYETAGQGGQASSCIGDIVFSGGNGGTGSSGAYCGSGGGGAAGGRGGNGGNGGNGAQRTGNLISGYTYHPGTPGEVATGSTYSGNGGAGVYTILISTDGNAGDTYGGGGSGGVASLTFGSLINPADGGDGAQGLVLITYTVPDPIQMDDKTADACSGKAFSVTPTGSNMDIYSNITYSWPAPDVTGIDGEAAGINQTTVNGTLINNTVNDIDVIYNVTAKSCDSTASFTVTVKVKGILTPGTIATNILSCNEGDTSKSFISATDATGNGIYFWEMSTDNVNWSIIDGETDKNHTPIYAVYPGVTYYKRGFYSDCDTVYSNVLTLTYPGTVFPGNVVSTQPQKYCKDSTVTALLSTDGITVQSGTSYSIQWQESSDNGTTWNNILDSVNNTFHVNIPHLNANVSYRYTITLAGCTDSIVSNNQWDYSLFNSPVINKLFAQDTCPENTEFYISADITPGDAPVTLYKWNASTSYGTYAKDTISKGFAPACGEQYFYTLMVKDTNGCVSDTAKGSFTTPTLILSDIPDQAAKLNPSECKYFIPNMKDTIIAHFNASCSDGIIQSYTCTPAEGSYIAFNTNVIDTIVVKDICGNEWTKYVTITAPSLPNLGPSDIDFDDNNDTIYLYYGVCDTLLDVQIPVYTTSSEYKDVLTITNNRNTSNTGPILGLLTPGTDTTITWKLSDPCGHEISFLKHYIVLYPQCGNGYTVTDVDGNEYQTVRVGCECWTKPNLKTITVSDTSFAYQNDTNNVTKFGRLYSWYSAVNLPKDSTNPVITIDPDSHLSYVQGICPTGWALPTTESFATLMSVAGDVKHLKSSDATTWLPGMNGNDATGFEAVGSGYYSEIQPHFYDLYGEVYFWTSEGDPITKKGVCSSITLTCPTMLVGSLNMNMGFSVRCVKRSND